MFLLYIYLFVCLLVDFVFVSLTVPFAFVVIAVDFGFLFFFLLRIGNALQFNNRIDIIYALRSQTTS